MKKLPWAFWRSREQMPASPKRRVHLGIDYGTSSSKIILRDYGAPGGEAAFVVLRNGSFRIPSRVCVTANEVVFGDDSKSPEECDIYASLKMRVAVEVTGNQKYYFGPTAKLPGGFTAHDLALLTVWFLISEGHRGVAEYFKGRMEGVSVGMTMGIPMAFFKEPQLKASFLAIAKQAWALYRNEGTIGSVLSLEKARRLLEKYRNASATPTPEYEVREWIRSEAEAAMWYPFQSPAVASGPYAKVDIGAGTTHASLFRIVQKNGVKTALAFFGAVSVSFGMDAVDNAIAESQRLGGDCLSLRGLEESILRRDGKARGALIPVKEEIYEAYRKAWIETYRKINETVAELTAWRTHKVFVIGGGSLVSTLVEANRVHPGSHAPLDLALLEAPAELKHIDNTRVSKNELPFVAVAYGLSNIGLSIPEAFTPDQIPPLPDKSGARLRLDRDDMYAK
jgi:hypothetical protein